MILQLITENIPGHQRHAAFEYGKREGIYTYIDAVDLLRATTHETIRVESREIKPVPQTILKRKDIPIENIGDHLEAMIKDVGLDKVSEWYEKMTGKKCKCPERKAWLNAFGQALKNYITT